MPTNSQQPIPSLPPNHESHDVQPERPVGREAAEVAQPNQDACYAFLDDYVVYDATAGSGQENSQLHDQLAQRLGAMAPADIEFVQAFLDKESEGAAKDFMQAFGPLLGRKGITVSSANSEPSKIGGFQSEEPHGPAADQPSETFTSLLDSSQAPSEAEVMGATEADDKAETIRDIKVEVEGAAAQIIELAPFSRTPLNVRKIAALRQRIGNQLRDLQSIDPEGFSTYISSQPGDSVILDVYHSNNPAKDESLPESTAPEIEAEAVTTAQTLDADQSGVDADTEPVHKLELTGVGGMREFVQDANGEGSLEVVKPAEIAFRISPDGTTKSIDSSGMMANASNIEAESTAEAAVLHDLQVLQEQGAAVNIDSTAGLVSAEQVTAVQPEAITASEKQSDARPMNEKREIPEQKPVQEFDKNASQSQELRKEINKQTNIKPEKTGGLFTALSGFFRKKNKINTAHVAELHNTVVKERAAQTMTPADDKHLVNEKVQVGKGIMSGNDFVGHTANLSQAQAALDQELMGGGRGDPKQLIQGNEEATHGRAA